MPSVSSKPTHEGQVERRGSESSDEEQGMVLIPLLSPPSDDYAKQSSNDSTSSSPLPLFLKVQCAVRDSRGTHKSNLPLSGGLPICLSKSPLTPDSSPSPSLPFRTLLIKL